MRSIIVSRGYSRSARIWSWEVDAAAAVSPLVGTSRPAPAAARNLSATFQASFTERVLDLVGRYWSQPVL